MSGVRISRVRRVDRKPPLSQIPTSVLMTPKNDPFVPFPIVNPQSVRLRAVCPGKRIVFSAGKPPRPHVSMLTALCSPRTQPTSPGQQKFTAPWSLVPARVRRRVESKKGMKKSNSLYDLRRDSVETPGFRQGHVPQVFFSPPSKPQRATAKQSLRTTCDLEVSFGS